MCLTPTVNLSKLCHLSLLHLGASPYVHGVVSESEYPATIAVSESVEREFGGDVSGSAGRGQEDAAIGGYSDTEPIVPVTAGVAVETGSSRAKRPKKKRVVHESGDTPAASHPPKRLRADYGNTSGSVIGGKSPGVLNRLLLASQLIVEQGVAALPTLPFITSSVTASPLEEGGGHTDFATASALRTVGPSERFVVLSDSSHYSSVKSAGVEVDSLIRPAAPVMTATTTVTTSVSVAATTAISLTDVNKDKNVPTPSIFAVSSSSEKTDPTLSLFAGRSGSDFTAGSIRAGGDVDTSLQEVYIPEWTMTKGFELNDGRSCANMIDHFTPPAFFKTIRRMEHKQLFAEFNVSAARNLSLSSEVRMRAEYNILEKRKWRSLAEERNDLLQVKDKEIEKLKSQLLQARDESMEEHKGLLEQECSALNLKVTSLESTIAEKDRELSDLETSSSSLRSHNQRLVDQVRELETSSVLGILYNRLNYVSIVVSSASVIVSTDLSKATNPLQAKELLQIKEMADQDTPPPTITAMKIPIIKKGEYDIWSMRMRQYICHTDHNLWDIIVNGDLEDEATPSGEQSSPPVPKTAKQLAARRNQERIKSILLLAIPDEYLLKFHNVPDAKSLWAAIKSRFGGNEESKKMQKNVLKHQFENFVTASNETLDKAYDRFQKLISQLEIHGAYVSKEDINQKFLRSLPPSWSQIALIMRNKPDIDEVDIDDLYNNLRVYEDELKRSSGSNSASQNLAFLSSENTNSTNEVSTASGDFGVSTAGGINQVPSTPSAHDIAYSFLAQPTTSPQLENEDFQQMDGDDLEELDLRWQVAMLTVRVKKFIQRTGRNMDFKEKRPVSLDKSKIECYNCHRKGHFARECRSGRSQGRRPYGDNGRSNAQTTESSSQALVAQDGLGGYDWSNDFEVEPVNYALMAISSSSSSSSSDSDVQKCSKCLESFKCLQKNYDTKREKHNKAKLEIRGYEIALESLEARILGHEKNELA
ncbi:ribonuclease H-like domain-containing protein [Tanacetum coccineum]